jgi:hypothetical protein
MPKLETIRIDIVFVGNLCLNFNLLMKFLFKYVGKIECLFQNFHLNTQITIFL